MPRKGPVTVREFAAALAALPADVQDEPLVVFADADDAEGFTLARTNEGRGPVDLVRGALTLTRVTGGRGTFRENAIPQRDEQWGAAVWAAS